MRRREDSEREKRRAYMRDAAPKARTVRVPNPRVIYKACPSCEFYTPRLLREVAHEVLGDDIDLDPATSERNPLGARRFFTRKTDGRNSSWDPPSGSKAGPIFMNHPFGLTENRLWTSLFRMHVARFEVSGLCLLPASVGTRWYRELTTEAQAVCELDGRIVFEDEHGEPVRGKDGRPQPARWGCVLAYFGPDRARVQRVLSGHGTTRLVRALARSRGHREREAVEALERAGQLRIVGS